MECIQTMFQEIAEKVWYIPSKDDGRYPYSNSLFVNDQKTLLIDSGAGRRNLKTIIKTFGAPDIILYSHGHEDHIPCEKFVPSSQKYIHENDKLMATSLEELYRIYGIASNFELQKLLNSYFKSFYYRPLSDVNIFTDGTIFDLGHIQVKVLHLPGHSAGHCGFEILNKSIIFSSDVDLTSFGPWYGALDSDISTFETSIKALMKNSPKIMITSHKGLFSDEGITENLQLYLNKISEREEKILRFLDKTKTMEELVASALMYGKVPEPKDYFEAGEKIMLEKHLEILIKAGKVELNQGTYRSC